MENHFDKKSAGFSDQELLYRVSDPHLFQPEAVDSAIRELIKRGIPYKNSDDLKNYLEQNKKKLKEENSEQLNLQKKKETLEKQLKGKLVGFGERLLAYVIDGLILFAVIFILSWVLNLFYPLLLFNLQEYGNLTSYLIALLYYVLFESSKLQATPGKICLRLKVVNQQGERINPLRAFGRYLSKIPSGMAFGLGYLSIIFNERKCSWHDQISKTHIVKRLKGYLPEDSSSDLLDVNLFDS